jgi:phosphatidylglycerol:prolipoprotein diacylglycerol transferase
MLGDISINFIHLGIKISDLGKSIDIFGFPIAYYGITIAIAILAGILISLYEAKKTGQDTNLYIDFAIYVIIFSIIGARLYYVIFEWDDYKDNLLEIFNTRGGGLAIYGGIIAAVLTCIVYTRLKKYSFWKVTDTACIGLITGQIIGRWGNFFNREAFGGYTDNLFAMQIKLDEVGGVITQDIRNHIVVNQGISYIQVHPTFLYESSWNLMVLILLLIFKKYKKYDGEVFLWYLGGYALGRAWIEGLRTDQLLLPYFNFPVSQLLSILIFIIVVIFLIYNRIRFKKREKK